MGGGRGIGEGTHHFLSCTPYTNILERKGGSEVLTEGVGVGARRGIKKSPRPEPFSP